jgi:hypothetical protein
MVSSSSAGVAHQRPRVLLGLQQSRDEQRLVGIEGDRIALYLHVALRTLGERLRLQELVRRFEEPARLADVIGDLKELQRGPASALLHGLDGVEGVPRLLRHFLAGHVGVGTPELDLIAAVPPGHGVLALSRG